MVREESSKIRFVFKLARLLHQYGASSYRLEGAVSAGLGLECDFFVGPTSCLLTIQERDESGQSQVTTKVIRLNPGDIWLARLSRADEVADQVIRGEIDPEEGLRCLERIDAELPPVPRWLEVLTYGAASFGVAGLLAAPWTDMLGAALVGLAVGFLAVYPQVLARQGNLEAVTATAAAFLAALTSMYLPSLSREVVVTAGLIVLIPGLSLTTAMAELASNHLVSGSARLAGASMSLLKLTFGVVLGNHLAKLLPEMVATGQGLNPPGWFEWVALLIAGLAFASLFRTRRRDLSAAMVAAVAGYAVSKYANAAFGPEMGIFAAGLTVASLGNAYARIWNRPASVMSLPGLILLVPGSLGFKGVGMMFQKDLLTGLDTGFALVVILGSLVAGLLFGNILVPPRRSL